MKLLLLGGSGHVSGAIARTALQSSTEVWAVTRGRRPLPAGVRPLVADRTQPGELERAVAGQTWDAVVDCIAYDEPDIRQDLALFRGRTGRFIFISTDFVYDPRRRRFPQPVEADHWAVGATGSLSYGQKKRNAELALIRGAGDDLEWTIFRPCHIYGPTSELGCLPLHGRDPQLIQRLRTGEPLTLVGGGHFLQQPILAADLARTVLSAVGQPRARNRIFNLAGPDILESRDYYRIVAEALCVEITVREQPRADHLAAHPE